MTRFATLHRNRVVAVADTVIFSGTPSQVVNRPAYVKSVVAAIIVFAGYLYATTCWHVPWFAPLIALLMIAIGVVVAYLRTACTEIVIDPAGVTCRQGIFNRQIQSLELFRIHDVTSLHPWW
ncbi:hypothetical protein [Paraburkholderia hospita]|uniref:PH domain-containing protein n=1 Tax=Paraburkholderia hospita TaxID=169430 RepID=A0AAN1JLS4_9BURK|nr:hypothetical protein [Paraburkholderia hospita]AUT76201.1 hypothetical protein C2L64_48845 [Paraburkholderia hospita]SEI19006.1 hypothetical protein SAMN05192544_103362 [Paraburkholderia hospita]